MNRREFALGLAGTGGLASLLAGPAHAQGEPVEGTHYVKLASPQPVQVPAGKLEVVEFFGYWCPHCYSFEPFLDGWARKLPPEVVFRRIPVSFGAPHEPYQKLFYALESMGQLETLHRKIFSAVHGQRARLDKDSEIVALATANGVDGDKLISTMKSFSVATKCNQAKQAASAWKIDGVPTLGVQGRFMTSVSQAGGHEQALRVLDALLQRARKA